MPSKCKRCGAVGVRMSWGSTCIRCMDQMQAARKAEQAAEKAEQEARRIASSRRAAEAEQAKSQQRQIQEAARAAAVAASEAERRELEGHLNGIKRMLLDHAARGVSDRATALQTVSLLMKSPDVRDNLAWFWADITAIPLLEDAYYQQAIASLGTASPDDGVRLLDSLPYPASQGVGNWLSRQTPDSVWGRRAKENWTHYAQVLVQRRQRAAEQARENEARIREEQRKREEQRQARLEEMRLENGRRFEEEQRAKEAMEVLRRARVSRESTVWRVAAIVGAMATASTVVWIFAMAENLVFLGICLTLLVLLWTASRKAVVRAFDEVSTREWKRSSDETPAGCVAIPFGCIGAVIAWQAHGFCAAVGIGVLVLAVAGGVASSRGTRAVMAPFGIGLMLGVAVVIVAAIASPLVHEVVQYLEEVLAVSQ